MKQPILLKGFFILLFLFVSVSYSQYSSVYVPRNIIKAYEKGTRSYDGRPGKNYWINHSDYKIQAEVFPKERIIKGTEQITYFNESPDTLHQLVFRLYQDIMKKGNSRDERINPKDITDGVKIDTLIINGKGIDINARVNVYRTATNLIIRSLQQPLAPKQSVTVEVSWSVIIPGETRLRMGAYNDSTLYVSYWYPQIAVYDDIDGWDRNDYGGAVEFYNDFNNYDVQVKVPAKFLVWATGEYQNLQDILKPEIYSRYKEALDSDGVVRIVKEEDLKTGATKTNEKTTWKFKADHVTDFTFATSSGYIWDGISAEVDAKGRRVLTDAVYPPNQKSFEEVAGFAKLTVENLSKNMPGIPFPYPKITTFNGEQYGGGGMEIPMMTNNGIYPTRAGQAGVTFHEIAHTYFPFYMGINERKYAWMDEGWATYFTSAQLKNLVPDADEYTQNITTVGNLMGVESDLPAITPSIIARGPMLGFSSYPKASIAYAMLEDALGKDLFKKCLHEYMARWNGKHPLPWDFFFTFNDAAKEDLSWFWNPWFFDRGYPDLGLKDLNVKKTKAEITVEKIGNVPVPIDLIITYTDGTTESVHKTPAVWKSGLKELNIEFKPAKQIKKIEINTKTVPDANPKNNMIEAK